MVAPCLSAVVSSRVTHLVSSPHSGQLRPPRPDQRCPGADWGMFNDLGVYGVPGPVKRKQRYDAVKQMRAMEK